MVINTIPLVAQAIFTVLCGNTGIPPYVTALFRPPYGGGGTNCIPLRNVVVHSIEIRSQIALPMPRLASAAGLIAFRRCSSSSTTPSTDKTSKPDTGIGLLALFTGGFSRAPGRIRHVFFVFVQEGCFLSCREDMPPERLNGLVCTPHHPSPDR